MRQRLRAWVIGVLLGVLAGLPSCGSPDALVLVLSTPTSVRLKSYIVKVQDRATRKLVYHSGAQRIGDGRDLSVSPLRVGLPFSNKGEFLVVVLAADFSSPDLLPQPGVNIPSYFFADILAVDQTQEVDAQLLPVPPKYDLDGDHFPETTSWLAETPEAAARYQSKQHLLDCMDLDPAAGDLLPIRLRAFDVHPLALSICDAKLRPPSDAPADMRPAFALFDTTCGGVPRSCVDADGDGEPENTDCDDNDARRHHGNPRPRNCCQCTSRASCATNHEKIADLSLCQPPRCDTSFDYDCSGLDVQCFTDEDCDGYSPNDPLPSQRDCDDTDPRVHPGATKICDPPNDADVGKDWACDGNPQGGCVSCDLDGDGFQRTDAQSNPTCPTDRYKARYAGKAVPIDCDDDDRGQFPGSTVYQSPLQLRKDNLTTNKGGTVAGALRGLCRNQDFQGRIQDSNCDGQPTLGCPTAACDADGDGYANASAGCAPADPKLLDCDDTNPTIFPDAPQYGKDGKDHNCDGRADTCGVDSDNDGYCSQHDCDDRDPSMHPFAADSCNGKDDDCDGLVDELNPDGQGNRMKETRMVGMTTVTAVQSCTDSSVGDCGARTAQGGYSGRCVCTGIQPNSKINTGSRVACPGETRDGSISPKCFGAIQPALQTCEADNPRDEDCDGRTDAPDGKNLSTGSVTSCGVTVGRCKAGKILGCDRSRANRFSKFGGLPMSSTGQVLGFNETYRFLTCDPTSGVVYPAEELCNGYDDDCDGKLPGKDYATTDAKAELDTDGDGFMRCTGCAGLDDSATFNKANFRACNDCNDSVTDGNRFYPAVPEISYPGAKELCDGLSNQCLMSFTPAMDGADQCGSGAFAALPQCCQMPSQCVDPLSDKVNCGGCGRVCQPSLADSCVNGSCQCKSDAPCDPQSQGSKRYCLAGTGCVQCRQASDCMGLADTTLTQCEPVSHRCGQCVLDTQCMVGFKCDSKALRMTTSDSLRCVRCASAGDCLAPTGACAVNADPTKNVCTQCVASADCPTAKPVCVTNAMNPAANVCVECAASADCKMATKPVCATNAMNPSANVCVECLVKNDCKMATKPVCLVNAAMPSSNSCVECLVTADCPMGKTCNAMNKCM